MRQLLTAPPLYPIPVTAAIASSTVLTIASDPPRHSSKNFCSAGVSLRADGGFFPSFTSNRIVFPINPISKSGIPSPWLITLTVAPIALRAATMSD